MSASSDGLPRADRAEPTKSRRYKGGWELFAHDSDIGVRGFRKTRDMAFEEAAVANRAAEEGQKMRSHIPILTAFLALAACVAPVPTPTPYQPADPQYGYTEQRREDGATVIMFAGNPETDRRTVENYALYRAAEFTLAAGKNSFDIVHRSVEIRMRETRWPTTPPHAPRPVVTRQGEVVYVEPLPLSVPGADITYAAILTIRSFSAATIKESPLRHNARDVMMRLGRKIVRPPKAPAKPSTKGP